LRKQTVVSKAEKQGYDVVKAAWEDQQAGFRSDHAAELARVKAVRKELEATHKKQVKTHQETVKEMAHDHKQRVAEAKRHHEHLKAAALNVPDGEDPVDVGELVLPPEPAPLPSPDSPALPELPLLQSTPPPDPPPTYNARSVEEVELVKTPDGEARAEIGTWVLTNELTAAEHIVASPDFDVHYEAV
jgi:hypothetical protein